MGYDSYTNHAFNDFFYPINTTYDDNDLEVSSLTSQSSARGSNLSGMFGLPK